MRHLRNQTQNDQNLFVSLEGPIVKIPTCDVLSNLTITNNFFAP